MNGLDIESNALLTSHDEMYILEHSSSAVSRELISCIIAGPQLLL